MKIRKWYDVLPTIIDVLEARMTWEMEGQSMFSDGIISRTEIEIPELGILKLLISWDFHVFIGKLNISVQKHHSTTFRHLGPYQELVGQQLDNLNIGERQNLNLIVMIIEYFKRVDLDKESFLPALFKGNIEGTGERNLSLAIAVNGRIWTTTKTSEWNGKTKLFLGSASLGAFH